MKYRLLKRKINKVAITLIQHTFQLNLPYKNKEAIGELYINIDCDEFYRARICHQKATFEVFQN